jgi:hypothetical protein
MRRPIAPSNFNSTALCHPQPTTSVGRTDALWGRGVFGVSAPTRFRLLRIFEIAQSFLSLDLPSAEQVACGLVQATRASKSSHGLAGRSADQAHSADAGVATR